MNTQKLNSELKKEIDKLPQTEGEILTKLLHDIAETTQREDIQNRLRSNVREAVTKVENR